MKKTLWLVLSLLLSTLTTEAQVKMRDVFAGLPDSIFPLITKNNRLDCIDFIENNMPALVNNMVDEPIELLQLTPDYLKLKMSAVSYAEMKLLPMAEGEPLICMVKTYQGPVKDSDVRFYDLTWKPVAGIKVPVADVKALLQEPTEAADRKTYEDALSQLCDLPLTSYSLSADANTLTLELQAGELFKKEREYAEKRLLPQVFVWDGRQFSARK